MPKLTVAEELKIAIGLVAREAAELRKPSREIAEAFRRDEKKLIEPFLEEWLLEKLTSMIVKERASQRAARNPQRVLGFRMIRTSVVFTSGEAFKDTDSTLSKYRLLKKRLGKEPHPLKAEVEKRIEFMERWSKKERGITFAEACQREAEKQGLLEGMEE